MTTKSNEQNYLQTTYNLLSCYKKTSSSETFINLLLEDEQNTLSHNLRIHYCPLFTQSEQKYEI